MHWLFFVLLGQFFLALAVSVDKVFLNKYIRNGFLFAFLVGLLSLSAVVLIPFGVVLPSEQSLLVNFIVGASLSIGLLCFFLALRRDDATRVAPFIGGATPVMTLIFSALILGERLERVAYVAVFLLVAGSIVLLWSARSSLRRTEAASTYALALIGAVAIALSFVLGRLQFITEGFITSFFWQRGGTIMVALTIFVMRSDVRTEFTATVRDLWNWRGSIFLASKLSGALGFMLMSYATKLTSATIVNALQGVQYVFLLALAAAATYSKPGMWKEELSGHALFAKLIATASITAGLVVATQL